jgi:hypothetical protein
VSVAVSDPLMMKKALPRSTSHLGKPGLRQKMASASFPIVPITVLSEQSRWADRAKFLAEAAPSDPLSDPFNRYADYELKDQCCRYDDEKRVCRWIMLRGIMQYWQVADVYWIR